MENLLLPLIILIPLLLITFRGRKQQKAFADLQQRLAAGQDVMTTAGLHGHLVSVDGDVVVLRIADGVQVRWARSAIATIISDPDVAAGRRHEARAVRATRRNRGAQGRLTCHPHTPGTPS